MAKRTLFQAIYEVLLSNGKTVTKKSATFYEDNKSKAEAHARTSLASAKAKNIKVYEK